MGWDGSGDDSRRVLTEVLCTAPQRRSVVSTIGLESYGVSVLATRPGKKLLLAILRRPMRALLTVPVT